MRHGGAGRRAGRYEAARHLSLDALRGIAVMGILAMNIVAFAMPEPAYLYPLAWGHEGAADLWAWGASFLLVEGKMRALFSILFGASMALVYERAQAAGGDGASVHKRRMGWLLLFGLIHYFLIWNGDILALYAVCGVAGMALLRAPDRTLLRAAAALIGFNFIVLAILGGLLHWLGAAAQAPGADADLIATYDEIMRDLGGAGPAGMLAEVSNYRSGYAAIVGDRFASNWTGPIELVLLSGPETIGMFALGMLLLRNGFLVGEWNAARYARFAATAYAIGLSGLSALLWWCVASGFDPFVVIAVTIAWATPFRLAVALGHAALALLLIRHCAGSALIARIAAAGRAAFTNYIGTSVLMTLIFYGYGFGLFGHVGRFEAYLICIPAWLLMLAWSKPWLDRFAYGPLEWLWRSAARGKMQVMRKSGV